MSGRKKREWQWPTDVELATWEEKLKGRKRSLSPGNQLLMVRAIRGQRKALERLTHLVGEIPVVPEVVGDMAARGRLREFVTLFNEPVASHGSAIDTERLDYLEAEHYGVETFYAEDGPHRQWRCEAESPTGRWHPSVRAAIDAAREAKP